jgi:hypothetical protein
MHANSGIRRDLNGPLVPQRAPTWPELRRASRTAKARFVCQKTAAACHLLLGNAIMGVGFLMNPVISPLAAESRITNASFSHVAKANLALVIALHFASIPVMLVGMHIVHGSTLRWHKANVDLLRAVI